MPGHTENDMPLMKSRPRIIETPAELGNSEACIVCSGPEYFTVLFVPRQFSRHEQLYGSRAIVYHICEACKSQPNWLSMAESRILDLLSVSGSRAD
jgi:hypothetical protein